jgi:hypothetical protein
VWHEYLKWVSEENLDPRIFREGGVGDGTVCNVIILPNGSSVITTASVSRSSLTNKVDVGVPEIPEHDDLLHPILLSCDSRTRFSTHLITLLGDYCRKMFVEGEEIIGTPFLAFLKFQPHINTAIAARFVLHRKLRLHRRDAATKVIHPVEYIIMHCTQKCRVEEGGIGKPRSRYDSFAAHQRDAIGRLTVKCFRMVSVLSPAFSLKDNSGVTLDSSCPKTVVIAQPFTETTGVTTDSYYDKVRGMRVHSKYFKYVRYELDSSLVTVSLADIIDTVCIYEDFENPGSFFKIHVE